MPPYYDIYTLSKNRDKATIEIFLDFFSDRNEIENCEGQEIWVYENKKYNTAETTKTIQTLSEVIDYGIKNPSHGFCFYISGTKSDINFLMLKFTFDAKIIFGISIEENIRNERNELVDNMKKAIETEQIMLKITDGHKSSIQVEYAPADDEEEFDDDCAKWKYSLKNPPIQSIKPSTFYSLLSFFISFLSKIK